jgi:predicted nucleic acid-binding protein
MRSVLLDANLLHLLVVGQGGVEDIRHDRQRLSGYGVIHFQALIGVIGKYDRLLVLPNTLTEVSNLIGDGQDERTCRARDALRAFAGSAEETYQPSKSVVEEREFDWHGLSDVAQLLVAKNADLFLTADGRLFNAALRRGLNAEFFNSKLPLQTNG